MADFGGRFQPHILIPIPFFYYASCYYFSYISVMKMSKCHRQSHILIDLYQKIRGLSADGHNAMVIYVCYVIDYDRAQI